MGLIWYKWEVDIMDSLWPFTAKKEGNKWVVYCAEGKRLGICSEGCANNFNELAADKEHWKTREHGSTKGE